MAACCCLCTFHKIYGRPNNPCCKLQNAIMQTIIDYIENNEIDCSYPSKINYYSSTEVIDDE